MTIEFSLRRRSVQARWLGVTWILIAFGLVLAAYFTLPSQASRILGAAVKIDASDPPFPSSEGATVDQLGNANLHIHWFALITLTLGVSAMGYGAYLVGRVGFMELERANRLSGIADVLCLVGSDFERLEKMANLLVPKSQANNSSAQISSEDLKSVVELLKKLR